MITAMVDCLPQVLELVQAYPPSPRLELNGLLKEEFAKAGVGSKIKPRMRIAVESVAVESRIFRRSLRLCSASWRTPVLIRFFCRQWEAMGERLPMDSKRFSRSTVLRLPRWGFVLTRAWRFKRSAGLLGETLLSSVPLH
jgi:hypothetical protein